jgi:hypothetical protein
MPRLLRRFSLLALIPVLALASACADRVTIVGDVIPGTYTATSFRLTPDGQPMIDVLAKGGSMTLTVAADNALTGLLSLPAGVVTPNAATADMAGVLVQKADGNYRFDQVANTFIKDLTWQQFTDAFVSTSYIGGVQFQITLRK